MSSNSKIILFSNFYFVVVLFCFGGEELNPYNLGSAFGFSTLWVKKYSDFLPEPVEQFIGKGNVLCPFYGT